MRTVAGQQRKGVARGVLGRIVEEARRRGYERIRASKPVRGWHSSRRGGSTRLDSPIVRRRQICVEDSNNVR